QSPGVGTVVGLVGEGLIGAQAVEGISGYDIATGESLEGGRRAQRLAIGVAAFAGTVAGVAGGVALATPLGAKMLPPKSPGTVPAATAESATAEVPGMPSPDRLIGGGDGDPPSRIPLSDVPVTRQPSPNTCVPTCTDMLLEEVGPGRSATII